MDPCRHHGLGRRYRVSFPPLLAVHSARQHRRPPHDDAWCQPSSGWVVCATDGQRGCRGEPGLRAQRGARGRGQADAHGTGVPEGAGRSLPSRGQGSAEPGDVSRVRRRRAHLAVPLILPLAVHPDDRCPHGGPADADARGPRRPGRGRDDGRAGGVPDSHRREARAAPATLAGGGGGAVHAAEADGGGHSCGEALWDGGGAGGADPPPETRGGDACWRFTSAPGGQFGSGIPHPYHYSVGRVCDRSCAWGGLKHCQGLFGFRVDSRAARSYGCFAPVRHVSGGGAGLVPPVRKVFVLG
mmetsp:Transcript_8769/g.22062  ORF Transcript_8769/g.22062 Transcript_8769/m.22062 type:complete len:299 (-) Transcript_8769:355-1251(-)